MSFVVVASIAAQKRALSGSIQPQAPAIPRIKSPRSFYIRAVQQAEPEAQPIARPPKKSKPLPPSKKSHRIETEEYHTPPKPVAAPAAPTPVVESDSIEGFKVTQLPSNVKKFVPVPETDVEVPEPEELQEKKDRPRGFLNREGQIKRFISCLKKKGRHWLWTKSKWNGTEPRYSVDGKSMPVTEAAYLLYHGSEIIPDGMKPYAKCHTHNCVGKECLILVPDETARRNRRTTVTGINEILRLRDLGKTDEQIADIIQRHDPLTVNRVIRRAL